MQQENTKSPIEIYRELVAKQPTELVDVTVPSGFTFKFKKPNKLGLLVSSGHLPHVAASEAVNAWQKRGLDTSSLSTKEVNELEAAEKVIQAFDKVLELSHFPKIVLSRTDNPNEFFHKDISDADMIYLMRWATAGGDASLMLAMFPQERRASASAGVNSGTVQSQTKRTRRGKR